VSEQSGGGRARQIPAEEQVQRLIAAYQQYQEEHGALVQLEHAQPHPRRFPGHAPVVQGVVDQHGDHLVQMARIDHGDDRAMAGDRLQAVGLDRHRLLVVVDKILGKGVQIGVLGDGPLAPGQAQHAFDDAIGALALLVDDAQRCRSLALNSCDSSSNWTA